MSIHAVSSAIAIRGVTPTEKLLLIALANYADEEFRCFPSQRRLAEETCLSERTIRTALATLEASGMISRAERWRADRSRASDLVTLKFAFTQFAGGGATVSGGVGQPLPGGGATASGLTTFEPSINHHLEPVEAQAPAPKVDPKGSRLPDNWFPSISDVEWADGFTPQTLATEADKFRDYWRAVPGAKGRKLDWDATWRNWIRRSAENRNAQRPDAKQSAQEANLTRSYNGALDAIRRGGG